MDIVNGERPFPKAVVHRLVWRSSPRVSSTVLESTRANRFPASIAHVPTSRLGKVGGTFVEPFPLQRDVITATTEAPFRDSAHGWPGRRYHILDGSREG